jgi:hypothetical protein
LRAPVALKMRRFTGATHAFVCVKLKPSLRASKRLCRLVLLEELLLGLELLRLVMRWITAAERR